MQLQQYRTNYMLDQSPRLGYRGGAPIGNTLIPRGVKKADAISMPTLNKVQGG